MQKCVIVWLKRDLRTQDHASFQAAYQTGLPVLPLFCFEPSVSCSPDFDIRHWRFQWEGLNDLLHQLSEYSGEIAWGHVEVLEALELISSKFDIYSLFSHRETGTSETFARDIEVGKWCKERGVRWEEFKQLPIQRGRENQPKAWDAQWIKFMKSDPAQVDYQRINWVDIDSLQLPQHLPEEVLTSESKMQKGGESAGLLRLEEFINLGFSQYLKSLPKAEKSRRFTSRLSSYLSWGHLSTRMCYQNIEARTKESEHKVSRNQFLARMKWQAHFIQKFEREIEMQKKDQNPAFSHLRKKKNKKYIKAWEEGMTGFPLVDACMRCVDKTGYLNFRMRALVVSFLTHHLWQPWQVGAKILARKFLDYEPGIHYPQFQMQAGTTGMHTLRIYNPIKQANEQDPEALFIKRWVPELNNLPTHLAQNPWEITSMEQAFYSFSYAVDYPKRIVDEQLAAKHARDVLWKSKKSDQARGHRNQIIKRHGIKGFEKRGKKK
jgi:deoxyribodipyrimidine photo-lyase